MWVAMPNLSINSTYPLHDTGFNSIQLCLTAGTIAAMMICIGLFDWSNKENGDDTDLGDNR